jgi:uncharacterized membrane protein
MTEAATPPPPVSAVAAPATESEARTLVIIVYGLYLGGFFCGGITGIVGVVLAYIKRGEARGTICESHFENAIRTFWILLGMFVLGATSWLVISFFMTGGAFVYFLVIGAGYIYFLYRTIKGLLRAIDSKPYA